MWGVPDQKYSEITFPILSPDPSTKKDVHFLKYPIYVGGNRGRGQIYPDGSKSNNTVYNATATDHLRGYSRVRYLLRFVKGAWSQKSKRVNWNHNPIVLLEDLVWKP